ncbi:MAG: LysR family transcriptional regulator, partial [Ruegeria sp.]
MLANLIWDLGWLGWINKAEVLPRWFRRAKLSIRSHPMPLRRLPQLSSLRAFEAAGRRGSIKEAALELAVTPGAVSQQIKALEADLGVPLFVRKTRAIHLTAEGQRLQPTISEAFLNIRQAVDDVRPQRAPSMRIGSTNALISKWLLPRLHNFTSKHPDIQVHIDSEPSSHADAEMTADVEIRYCTAPPRDIYSELLHREHMLVVASPTFLERHNIAGPLDIGRVPVLIDTSTILEGKMTSWDFWIKEAGGGISIDTSKAIRFDKPPGGPLGGA